MTPTPRPEGSPEYGRKPPSWLAAYGRLLEAARARVELLKLDPDFRATAKTLLRQLGKRVGAAPVPAPGVALNKLKLVTRSEV